MKVLVANNSLKSLGGSETFTYTLVEELKNRNYDVEYFTFHKGLVSDKIEADLNVSFMANDNYDLIFANHHTCVDKLYKKGFVIQTCHGVFPKLEQPSRKANGYVSISEEVQNHLASLDIPSLLIYNSINLERFKPVHPIRAKLETVLSLCHSEEANNFVSDACEELGISFIKAYKYDNPVWDIENIINQADLVVGLGRSAYESMACGRPVIIYDTRSYFESCGDGYIRDCLGFSLRNNCSGRYSLTEFDKKHLIDELDKYNPRDGEYFRSFSEKELDIKKNLDKYLSYVALLKRNREIRKKDKIIKYGQIIFGRKGFSRIIQFSKTIGLVA